jgi:sigma-B regulation protein RsbU (phosphoserine phosphatase)
MRAGSQRRRGSLAFTLIVTIAALLAAALGGAAFVNFRTLTALAERETASRRGDGEAAMQSMSILLARNAAASAALPLADGNFTYLDSLVAETLKQDRRLRWMLIADAGSNRVVARTPGAPPGQTLADPLAATVLAAPPTAIASARDPDDPTRFTFGMKVVVGERVVGQLRLGVSTAELEAELASTIAAARADAGAAARETLIGAALILVLGMLLGAWQGVRIARPLGVLSAQAHRIAEGDLDHRVDVRARDEIGRLAEDFNFMADRLVALLAETASKASLEREMSLARSVQESMNPTRQIQEVGPFRVVGSCEPASECGGDWWTLRKLGGDRLLVVVGDVTGHGIPSAMVAATARGAVEAMSTVDDAELTPELVLRAIQRGIRGVGTQQLLMTCFAAILDPGRGVVEYSNAGHNFPYLVQTESKGAHDLAVLALRGSPLGNLPGEFVLNSGRRSLRPGDVLVFYTDGVIDRVDGKGNRFGDRRLRAMLLAQRLGRSGAGLAALRDTILAEVGRFAGGAPADDDITLVLLSYDPPEAAGELLREAHG